MKYTKVADVKDPKGNWGDDNGTDFFIPNDWNDGRPYKLYMNEQINIPTGIKVLVERGKTLKMDNKSGVAVKKGLLVGATIVDPSYRGVVHINLHKASKGSQDEFDSERGEWYTILTAGEKICQGLILACSDESWEALSNEDYDEQGGITERGANGFGNGTGQN